MEEPDVTRAGVATDGTTIQGLADHLGDLARNLHHRGDGEGPLTDVVRTALRLIPQASDASISLMKGNRQMESRAATGDLPRVVDAIQTRTGEGPCITALRERVVRVPDLGTDDRWPRFSPAALDTGVRSMLCFQLFVHGEELGALNFFARTTDAFDFEAEHVGALVATHAAIALADAKVTKGLNEALISRDLIGQAKGILMERYTISAHQAFVVLSAASSKANMKLSAVAEQLISTGDLAASRKPPAS